MAIFGDRALQEVTKLSEALGQVLIKSDQFAYRKREFGYKAVHTFLFSPSLTLSPFHLDRPVGFLSSGRRGLMLHVTFMITPNVSFWNPWLPEACAH